MVKENKRREIITPVIVLILMIYGILAITSAVAGDTSKNGYPLRQIVWNSLALAFMFLTIKISKRILRDTAIVLYMISIFFLAVVLFKGQEVGGAKRWMDFGVAYFQPSEIAKLSLVVLLPILFEKVNLKNILFSIFLTLIPFFLVILEPDLGTAALLFFIWFAIFFASSVNIRYVMLVVVVLIIILPLVYFFGLKDYQRNRIMAFLNPEKFSRSSAYNVIQSIHAMGSGGVFGKGFMKGNANLLNFVPVDYSDFIIAVIGEEFGFIGVFSLIVLYSSLLMRMYFIRSIVEDEYWGNVVVGVASVFFFHIAENLLMCSGLAPVTGIPLPFVSYGGSSTVAFGIMIGLVIKAYAISKVGREAKWWIRWRGSFSSSG
jgi:rod shape determining protein RodA